MFTDRRPGDVAWLWCSPEKAKNELNWVASRNITDMCRDMWRFQSMNPTGYAAPQNPPNDPSPDTLSLSVSEDGDTLSSDTESSDKKSDSGLSSDGDLFDSQQPTTQRKSFLHFLKKTNIPGPTHAGTRDL